MYRWRQVSGRLLSLRWEAGRRLCFHRRTHSRDLVIIGFTMSDIDFTISDTWPVSLCPMSSQAHCASSRTLEGRARSGGMSDSTVRMGSVVGIPELLTSLGADPKEVLGELGIELKLFDDPRHRMSLSARNRIVKHCATRTDCRTSDSCGQQDWTALVRSHGTSGEAFPGREGRHWRAWCAICIFMCVARQ